MNNMYRESDLRVLLLVVIYRTKINDSVTVKTILSQKQSLLSTELIIWDNSPIPSDANSLESIKSKFGQLKYISTPENVSLSKIYNHITYTNAFDYIMLLDQDSLLSNNYFEELHTSIKKNKNLHLFLPIVKNRNTIVSPGYFKFFKGKYWNEIKTGILKSRNTLAITSGMVISKNYFSIHSYRFDERLNLYGIDTSFMLAYAKNEKELFVMPTEISHNSALLSDTDIESLIKRYKNLNNAWSVILSDRKVASILNAAYMYYRSIKLALKYKDLRFLR